MSKMLIVNPVSGKGLIKNYLLPLTEKLCANGEPCTVFVTSKHGDATELANKYGGDYDILVCNGGDGTLNEVVNGIMPLPAEKRPTVGYLPLGTTNDMAASFRFPKAPEEVIAHIGEHDTITVDVGQFGDVYFGYVAAFGSFTDIPFQTPQDLKNTWGYMAYVVSALNSLPTLHPTHARITWEGGVIEDDFIMGAVMNSTSVAGFIKLPEEDVALDDGLLEVLLIRSPKSPIELNNAVADVLSREFNTDMVTLLHTKKVRFEFLSPVTWTLDGENGGAHEDVTAIVHPRALRLFV